MATKGIKAISDIGTILTHAAIDGGTIPTSGFEKLIGIRSTPQKGEAPEELDATEMDDTVNVSIAGRKTIPALEYTFNWTADNVAKLEEVAEKRHAFLEVLPDDTGHLSVGTLHYWHNGSGLNEVQEGTLVIIAEEIELIQDVTSYVS